MSEADLITGIIAAVVCPPCWVLSVFWSRRAAQYNRITRKLYAGEPLTGREQCLLDKSRD